MDHTPAYAADSSLKGKLRRRSVRLMDRRPARLTLQRPMVSFTFDDPPASAAEAGVKILEAHGVRGTYFVSAGLTGEQGPMGRYASRPELMALAAAGHELGCHTFSHLDCGQARAAEIDADAKRNRAVLSAWGAAPTMTFAYPYGDVSLDAKRVLGGQYQVLRALHPGLIETGTDLNQAPSVGIEGPDGPALAARWLRRAAKRTAWLILYSHDVIDQPSQWGCTPAALAALVSLAVDAGFDVVTVAEGARRLG
ncbi:MAG TPA: polysaccharide deacetylase family protein [Caulobacteraceae bacterium]|jgi:peptidoglycan/xylan/chitin deacetylase (PgdA/CDA1 family)